MTLPQDHKLEYEGKKLNWFIGDHVTFPKFIPNAYWAWGIPEEKGWNTMHAIYCGKFNNKTRELYDIKLFSKTKIYDQVV